MLQCLLSPLDATIFLSSNLVLKLAHAAPNIQFSFFSTEHSNKLFLSKPHIPHTIKFFNVADGVPDNHIPGDQHHERVRLFLQAAPVNFQMAIDLAVAETKQRLTCIIADAFVTPSLTLAQHLNLPWIAIYIPLPRSLSAHFHTHLIRQKFANANNNIEGLDFIPGLSEMQVDDLLEDVLIKVGEEETLFSKLLASLGTVLSQAKAVVVSSFEELDSPVLVEDMRSKLKAFLYVGFLTVSLPLQPLPPSHTDATGCLSWLDKHNGGSVAYVAFGTAVMPPPHEIVAVPEALEESGFPFLWSLKDHVKGLLLSGFLERTNNRGKVVPWDSQTQGLGHGLVGVYVTHCGCNSVFKSVSNAVPMICRPIFANNMMIARMVTDVWEIGMRVEGGVFTKDGLLKCLNLILVQEEGKKMRENAMKLKRTVLGLAGPEGRAAQDFKTLVLEVVSSS